jgi:hypothetical protein
VLLPSSKDSQFKKELLFIANNETSFEGQIANTIYGDDLSLTYYRRYLKEESSNDIIVPTSMHLLFESNLEQPFKEDPKQ